MIIDLKEKEKVSIMPGGVQAFMSWSRLIEALRKSGEFNSIETITHIRTDLSGLRFRIE